MNLSVRNKILVSLATIFVALMVATTWRTAASEREMVQDLATARAIDAGRAYFDAINTMMLTGTAAQRGIAREKAISHPDVVDTRLIRADSINAMFGPGFPEQGIVDDLDQRALDGETVIDHSVDENGRIVTVIVPTIATKESQGSNCVACHPVPEGSVLGAVRVSYSLARLDSKIEENLLVAGGINIVILIVGMGLVTWFMGRIVIFPLTQIRDVVRTAERDADLGQHLEFESNDEIGELSSAFNGMLKRLAGSLSQVSQTTRRLNDAASRITEVAAQTARAAEQQRLETDMAAKAITELQGDAAHARSRAAEAADASVEADRAATEGAKMTKDSIAGIYGLVSEIERAAGVISRLDQRSKRVGSVLDVIKSIAEQTNLLALNAAIEAARAGEQGRGFAVVADEVRTLATRSQESTHEIEDIVQQLQSEAREAVAVMATAKTEAENRRDQISTADASLNHITEQVTRIRQQNKEMVEAAEQQDQVTQEVRKNINTINELADQTAKDAEHTAAVSADLAGLSGQLSKLVGEFKF